jgi:hypothetical protein
MSRLERKGAAALFVNELAACCTCGFLRHQYRKNPRLMGCLRSLQGKKPPDRRFFGVLCAKRNKLLENKKISANYATTE